MLSQFRKHIVLALSLLVSMSLSAQRMMSAVSAEPFESTCQMSEQALNEQWGYQPTYPVRNGYAPSENESSLASSPYLRTK